MTASDSVAQDPSGRLRGRLVRTTGAGIEGATVEVRSTSASDVNRTTRTSASGEFGFDHVAPGTYVITLTLGSDVLEIQPVSVTPGAETAVDQTVDWTGFAELVVVRAPSRQSTPLGEAPAPVTVLGAGSIADQASHHEIARLVQFMDGVQITQGGIYDYNVNTRGFNSSLNRRVAVLIDGRNPAEAFFDAQEWAGLGMPLDNIASIELVRGPSAALYGANASSGVLVVTTKDPRRNSGGLVRFTFGGLNTKSLDVRWAGAVSDGWYASLLASARHEGDFFASRQGAVEYAVPCSAGVMTDCLPPDIAAPLRMHDNDIFFGGARLDRQFAGGPLLTMEGGLAHASGPMIQTGVGRAQIDDVKRPWARIALRSDHGSLLFAYTGRHAPQQLTLSSGTTSTLNSRTFQFEAQTDRTFADDRVWVIGGGSAGTQRVDSFNRRLRQQTAVLDPVFSSRQALFGQIDWNAARPLRFMLAARADFSSLHDAQFSPRVAAIYTPRPSHSLRATYSRAFQVPNFSEYFLHADAAAPRDLGELNALCAPFNIDCGFGSTRVLALGNRDLDLEKTWTIEGGYRGVIATGTRLTVDYYRSRTSNFVTDLLSQLGTPLGRVNPAFGPWRPPAGVPDAAAAQIRTQAPAILSNDRDGSPILAAASYTNFGRVDSQGADLGLQVTLPAGGRGLVGYSWFDYDFVNPVPGLDRLVAPNTPRHTLMAGAGYGRGRLAADLAWRRVDTFRWSVGPFQGNVDAYSTADLSANYRLHRHVNLSLHISNVFDDRHWETFGGDVLRRRALVGVTYLW